MFLKNLILSSLFSYIEFYSQKIRFYLFSNNVQSLLISEKTFVLLCRKKYFIFSN